MQYLLMKVNQITEHYNRIARENGENFNLFDILDRRTDEVKTHSSMIAELLNPRGNHDMGRVFLNLFIEMLRAKYSDNLQYWTSDDTEVYVEYFIGNINDDEGGRIDILMANKRSLICIENKIHADDQPLQLRRYHNYLQQKDNQEKLLVYLTLNGSFPSVDSIKGKENSDIPHLKDEEDYFRLSYKEDIISWLQECVNKCSDKPLIRYSLAQYIILLKGLTHQLTSNKMEKEVRNAILNDIVNAETIRNNYDDAINGVALNFRDDVEKEFISRLHESEKYVIEYGKEKGGFCSLFIWFPELQLHIGLESFNGKSLEKDALFIGRVDWRRKNSGETMKHSVWIRDSIEKIWKKEVLFQNLRTYAFGSDAEKSQLVNVIVENIIVFKKRNNTSVAKD